MEAATYVSELLLWSTMHLVWQSALLCAIYGAWAVAHKPSAHQRHSVAMWMLASLPLLLTATALATHATLVVNAREGAVGAIQAHSSASLEKLSALFEHAVAAMPVLAVIWCIGAILGAAHILRQQLELSRLLPRLRLAPPEVVDRVEALAAIAGVATRPRVLLGEAAPGAPFVAGAWQPALILPLVDLSEDEWNAVVLHELAHVRRRDYAMNRAVQILNAILWFNPASRMLERWAAAAREECCDEEAARLSAAPAALARALVRIAEYEPYNMRAVAATSGSLLDRVQRVLSTRDHRSSGLGRAITPLVIGFALCTTGTAIVCGSAPSVDSLAVTGASAAVLPADRVLIHAVDPAGRFTLTTLNGRVAMATIGGVAVDRRAVQVRGERITVLSASAQPALSLLLNPRGGITWNARRFSPRPTARE